MGEAGRASRGQEAGGEPHRGDAGVAVPARVGAHDLDPARVVASARHRGGGERGFASRCAPPPPALRVLAIANAAGAGADEDADTIWEALGDMRADAAGKHDARLELAVLSGDGKCVTRGRVQTIDDDDDDDDDAGDSGTGKTERTDAETRRRAAEKQRRSPCCFGAAARELWTVPDADVDAWLARHEPRAHESCGAAEDANANLFLLGRRTEPMSRW